MVAKPKLSLKQKLGKVKAPKKPKQPIWEGPESDGPQGGVTQSLLSRFLVCRERFRLLVVEGLTEADTFNHRIEYGTMWHLCEEALAAESSGPAWEYKLKQYAQHLCQRYNTQQEQVRHWYHVCRVQFPHYVQYWKKHPDVKERTPLLQEVAFRVPYLLPSGRTVYLRGKWDAVDIIGKGKKAGIYLQENKTKSVIDEVQLKGQLRFDLQTMLYLVALETHIQANGPLSKQSDGLPLKGVRYNVIRRPLSGGKGTIRKHQPTKSNPQGETDEEFYGRLSDIIKEDPASFFVRWRVEVSPADIEVFKQQCLNPVLEQLCDWWHIIQRSAEPFEGEEAAALTGIHWRTPYGLWNPMADGGVDSMDHYLSTGSEVGLRRTATLFSELE